MKIGWLFVPLFLLGLTGVFYVIQSSKISKEAELVTMLQSAPDFIRPSELSNDELRTQLFRHELTTNPPFSLSQADLDTLSALVVKLEQDAIGFGELYNDEAKAALLREYLYPINFLKQAIATEAKRRTVIAKPDQANAEAYMTSLKSTLNLYKEYIAKLKLFVNDAKSFPYGLIDGSIEKHTMLVWLTNLESRADEAQLWIALQSNCLAYYREDCATDESLLSVPDKRSPTAMSYSEAELNFANYFMQLESHGAALGGNGEPVDEVPLIEYRGYCSEDGDARFARMWWNQDDASGIPYARFVYVDEPLFFDHEANKIFFSEFLIKQGVPYQHQPINHYLCNHYGADFTAISSDYAIWYYVKHKILPETNVPQLQTLRALERQLQASTSTIKHEDAANYIHEVQHVLATQDDYFTPAERAELTDLLLGYRDGSLFYERRLGSIINNFEFSYASFKRITMPEPSYIVLAFSALPVTLLADNPHTLARINLPVQKYGLDTGYPHIFSGLDTLSQQNIPVGDPLEYLQKTVEVLDQLKQNKI